MTDAQITASLVSGSFTVLAALLAFIPIAYQIRKQGELNRRATIEEDKLRFKADLYRDGVSSARRLTNAATNFSSFLHSAQFEIEIASRAAAEDMIVSHPTTRFPEILGLHKECADAVVDLIFLIEERRIFDPRLVIFRDMLNTASHDKRRALSTDFQVSLMQALPTDRPTAGIYPYSPPSNDELENLNALIEPLSEALSDLIAYAEDFIVELQNVLIGDTFDTKVEHRTPLDPNKRVVRMDDFDELSAWIETTAWGKERARIEGNIAKSLELDSTEEETDGPTSATH